MRTRTLIAMFATAVLAVAYAKAGDSGSVGFNAAQLKKSNGGGGFEISSATGGGGFAVFSEVRQTSCNPGDAGAC